MPADRSTYELLAGILVAGAAVLVSYGAVWHRFVRQHKSIGWPRKVLYRGFGSPSTATTTLWKLSECFFTPVAFLVALGMLTSAGSNTVLSIMLAFTMSAILWSVFIYREMGPPPPEMLYATHNDETVFQPGAVNLPLPRLPGSVVAVAVTAMLSVAMLATAAITNENPVVIICLAVVAMHHVIIDGLLWAKRPASSS